MAEQGNTISRPKWAVSVPASLMDDSRISMEARGTMALLMTMADDWRFYEKDLRRRMGNKGKPIGREKYQRIIRELKDAEYLIVTPSQDAAGRIKGNHWQLEPMAAQDVVYRQPENPATGDDQLLEKPADGLTGGRETRPHKEKKPLKDPKLKKGGSVKDGFYPRKHIDRMHKLIASEKTTKARTPVELMEQDRLAYWALSLWKDEFVRGCITKADAADMIKLDYVTEAKLKEKGIEYYKPRSDRGVKILEDEAA